MAADWIRVRTDLYRDPKVSVIADELMQPDGDLARHVNQMRQRDMTVTRNVMRNVTVGALVSVWGVMRQRGKREGDSLICRGVTAAVIDDIADIPGFGDALMVAGWVREVEQGIEFPNFFEEFNTDPHEAAKSKNAERQARHRAKKKAEESDVTRNVTVTPREEKSREENNSSSIEEENARDRAVVVQADDVSSSEPKTKPARMTAAQLVADGLTPQAASEFIDLRKRKRAPLTPLAWSGIKAEAGKAGWSAQQAVQKALERGWTGFEAGWVAPRAQTGFNGAGFNRQEALEARNRAVGEEWLRQTEGGY